MGDRCDGRACSSRSADGRSSLADDARSEGVDGAIWHGGPGPGPWGARRAGVGELGPAAGAGAPVDPGADRWCARPARRSATNRAWDPRGVRVRAVGRARHGGEPGRPPRDIDVLVIGDASLRSVHPWRPSCASTSIPWWWTSSAGSRRTLIRSSSRCAANHSPRSRSTLGNEPVIGGSGAAVVIRGGRGAGSRAAQTEHRRGGRSHQRRAPPGPFGTRAGGRRPHPGGARVS